MQAIATALLLPPTGPLLLSGLGLLLLARGRRLGLAPGLLGLALAWVFSSEAPAEALINRYAPATDPRTLLAEARACSAEPGALVLVLGAGVQLRARGDGGADLKPMTAERLRRGLWWSRQLGLPLAFSGGLPARVEPGTPTEAAVAAETLAQLGQASLVWADALSADTRGNARFSAEHIRRGGSRCLLLVTHDLHMPRALSHFRRQLAEVRIVPAPLGRTPGEAAGEQSRWREWLPSLQGSQRGGYLAYELLARLAGH